VSGEALVVSQFTLYARQARRRKDLPAHSLPTAPWSCASDLPIADRRAFRCTGSFGAATERELDNEGSGDRR